MELNIRYEKDDWIAFQSYLEKEMCKSTKSWHDSMWVNFVIWLVIAFTFFSYFQSGLTFSWSTAGIVSFFFIFIYAQIFLSSIKIKEAFRPLEGGTFLGEHQFTFDNEYIHTKGKGYKASHSWGVITRLKKSDEGIYLFLDSAYAYIFPLSKLENPDQFYQYVTEKINVTKSSSKDAASGAA